jgi:hypothetical protein
MGRHYRVRTYSRFILAGAGFILGLSLMLILLSVIAILKTVLS